jgi:hypothetical protein
MQDDIKQLGWFWGTMQTMIRGNPKVTIAEALGEGPLCECQEDRCHRIFATAHALNQHFSLTHAAETQQGCEANIRCLQQDWTLTKYEDSDTEGDGEVDNGGSAGEVGGELALYDQVRPRRANPPDIAAGGDPALEREGEVAERREQNIAPGLRMHPAQVIQQRQEAELNEQIAATRAEFIRKKNHHEANVSRGVNIPQLNAQQMKSVKAGLSDLFKNELNRMIAKMMPDKGDWDRWLAFEGAYEEVMHRLREHIIHAIQRNPQ